MSLKLNKLDDDEDIIDDIDRCQRCLNRFLPEADENIEDVNVNERVASSSEDLGYMVYQQESGSSRDYFKITSRTITRVFTYIEEPQDKEHTRSPWEYFDPLNIVIAFGEMADRKQLIKTKEIKYNHNMRSELEYVVLYLRLINSYLADTSIDPDLVARLNDKKFIAKNNQEVTSYVKPMFDGLMALIDDNEQNWLAAVNLALENHLSLVKRGDYRKDEKGFICMPAMALVKLGIEKGYKTNIDSLYLPLNLMELEL